MFQKCLSYVLFLLALFLVAAPFVWVNYVYGQDPVARAINLSEDGIKNPKLFSASEDNDVMRMEAERALPDDKDSSKMTVFQPRIFFTSGQTKIWATKGLVDLEKQKMVLSGDVRLKNKAGYDLKTLKATVDVTKGFAQGHEGVEGKTPQGYVRANGFIVEDKGARIRLVGGVKIQYDVQDSS